MRSGLHLQHVGSPLGLLGRSGKAARDGETIHRVHGLRFALDRLLAGELTLAFLRELFLGDGPDLAPWGWRQRDILAWYGRARG